MQRLVLNKLLPFTIKVCFVKPQLNRNKASGNFAGKPSDIIVLSGCQVRVVVKTSEWPLLPRVLSERFILDERQTKIKSVRKLRVDNVNPKQIVSRFRL